MLSVAFGGLTNAKRTHLHPNLARYRASVKLCAVYENGEPVFFVGVFFSSALEIAYSPWSGLRFRTRRGSWAIARSVVSLYNMYLCCVANNPYRIRVCVFKTVIASDQLRVCYVTKTSAPRSACSQMRVRPTKKKLSTVGLACLCAPVLYLCLLHAAA